MRSVALAFCLLGASATLALATDDPLLALAKSSPQGACFARDYDPTHLAAHPQQLVKQVTAALVRDPWVEAAILRLAITRKDGSQIFLKGGCPWEAALKMDGEVRKAFPQFRGNAGALCWAYISPESAEEAGNFLVGMAPQPGAITVHLGDQLTGRTAQGGGKLAWRSIKFGAEDRVMRLDRAELNLCNGLAEKTGP